MDAKKESLRLLKEHGTPTRHNKHRAYRIAGHLVTVTDTKTNYRGWRNKLSEIRRVMRSPLPEARPAIAAEEYPPASRQNNNVKEEVK